MAKTVIGLFTDPNRAETAMDELARADIERSDMDLFRPDERERLSGELEGCGVPEHDARLFDLAVQRGHTLLMIGDIDDDLADTAAGILDRHGAIDLEEIAPMLGAPEGRPAPAMGNAGEAGGMPTGAIPGQAAGGGEEIREEVVEERIRVGKREVGKGGVRVFSRVTERPVSEEVRLREEEVHVERRPVDRPAMPGEMTPGKGQVEVRATAEEPVVQKEARVVEEVVVSKDVRERTEEIRDTVRRKDVEVQEVPGKGAQGGAEELEPEYQRHYRQSFEPTGARYETVAPAYRYGRQLGADPRYSGRDWDVVRSEARRDWEQRSPGTFDRFENAMRYAYDRIRGRGR